LKFFGEVASSADAENVIFTTVLISQMEKK